jgi:hypothetical protein
LAFCIGFAAGPAFASLFYFIGGYTIPFLVVGLLILACIPFIFTINFPNESDDTEEIHFFKALMNFVFNYYFIIL